MRWSLQVQYAIYGIFDLAYNGHGEAVQVRVIGERQAIPVRYLEQIFQRMRKAGLVTSKRGPGGGYRLARGQAAISLRDVVEAVEGPLVMTLGKPPPAEQPAPHRPDFLWHGVADRLRGELGAVTLEDLCRQARDLDLEGVDPDGEMYFI